MDRPCDSKLFCFYRDRVVSARNYGLFSGDQILAVIMRTAFMDSHLTNEEFDIIINLCEYVHKLMMEDNYNEGWN